MKYTTPTKFVEEAVKLTGLPYPLSDYSRMRLVAAVDDQHPGGIQGFMDEHANKEIPIKQVRRPSRLPRPDTIGSPGRGLPRLLHDIKMTKPANRNETD